MNITEKRTKIIIDGLVDKHNLEYCSHYGEPGYTDPEKGVLLCNWNDVSQSVQDYLEEDGFELEGSDEWSIDYDYSKAYRTEPDRFGWSPSILMTGYGVLTPDDDISEWIEYCEVSDWDQCYIDTIYYAFTEEELKEEGYELYDYKGWSNDLNQIANEVLGDKYDNGIESVIFQDAGKYRVYVKRG